MYCQAASATTSTRIGKRTLRCSPNRKALLQLEAAGDFAEGAAIARRSAEASLAIGPTQSSLASPVQRHSDRSQSVTTPRSASVSSAEVKIAAHMVGSLKNWLETTTR